MWWPPCTGRKQRSTRRSSGFSLLELVVSIALIGVFIGVLLDRLLYYQEAAEKAVMELEATKLKLALQVYIGDLIARNRPLDFDQIARENPMRWLETPLAGYRGEFSGQVPVELPKGSWYFDRSGGELVYVVKLDRYFQTSAGGPPRVRWRVKLVRPQGPAAQDDTVVGLQLVPVQPYRWF